MVIEKGVSKMWWIRVNRCLEKTRWHKWYAWYPVKIWNYYEDGNHKVFWLEYVERQECSSYVVPEGYWDYRDLSKQ